MKFHSLTAFATGVLLASAGLSSSVLAAPLPAPANDFDFTASGSAMASYNSNVLSASDNNGGVKRKFDDYIFTFTPGVGLKYGGFADTTLAVNYSETIYRYYVRPSLNEELSNVGFSASRKQGEFDLSAGFSYSQNYNNTPSSTSPTLSSIIRDDVIDANAHAHWNFSEKFNFDAGFDYTKTDYLYSVGRTYQDSETYSLPVSGYYVYSQELSVGAGYTYSQTNPKPAAASPGTPGRSRYNNTLSLNTQLTKWNKLSGTANVGVTQNHIDADSSSGQSALDSTNLSYGVNLKYDYSEPLGFTFNGSRSYSTGTEGQNIQATSAGIGAVYNYSTNISATANLLTYTYSQYFQQNRHDDNYTSGITLTWKPYTFLSLSAGYSYFMNSSDAASSTYNINVVTASVTVNY